MFSIFLIVIGAIFVFYDFILIISNPGTFLDNLTSFTHIWLAMGALLYLPTQNRAFLLVNFEEMGKTNYR